MISKESYTERHIKNIKDKYPQLDYPLIEKTIFALGLLEALVKVEMPFIFKGGTNLLLILNEPYRLSTDIDIIVDRDCDVNSYLDKVSLIYPFIRKEEDKRRGKNNIIKKHYKFLYKSPLDNNDEFSILLDVLFEENGYEKVIEKEIKSNFLITEGNNLYVKVPSIESLLGDKLTAFAPNTIGVPKEKEMEVIKQFLDCAQLIKEVNSFDEVLKTYRKIYKNEIQYRGINASLEDCLMDTFNASLAIYTRGGINKKEFEYLLRGIKKISQHVFGFTINGETAYLYAADVMLACACLIKNISYLNVEEQDIFTKKSLKVVNKTKKLNKEAFNKVAAAIRLLGLDKE